MRKVMGNSSSLSRTSAQNTWDNQLSWL